MAAWLSCSISLPGGQDYQHGGTPRGTWLGYLREVLALTEAPLTGPGALEFSTVGVSYHSDRTILEEVSFQAPAGKTLGIVGHSGSGKSTIVRLVTRLIEPDSGRILLDGVPISEFSLTRLREAIAVVPQDTILLNDTSPVTLRLERLEARPKRSRKRPAWRICMIYHEPAGRI